MTVEPWQVWWADFNLQVGREQSGLRPAIVVGTPLACSLPNDLAIVVPCTTRDRGLPFHPRIQSIQRATFAMCDQIKSISRDRLCRRHPTRLLPTDVDTVKFVIRQLIDVR
ncbi:MAG TPA: type II toxin-antitoxin system PemK/MazF family toxin [Mycobacteriales bacterium]|nr:type II toxin-antitoxin system PemK/MazF family toxin [Mycobacteriales bacterium]